MNKLKRLYFSTNGRLNRQPYWLAFAALLVVMAIAGFAVVIPLVLEVGFSSNTTLDQSGLVLTQEQAEAAAEANRLLAILALITAYPWFCLMIKRAKDRDLNLNILYLYWVLVVISIFLQLTGLTHTYQQVGPAAAPELTTVGSIASLGQIIQLVLGIYLFVVLGFFRGTVGDNQHGPDPLGGKSEEAQFDDAKLDG